MNRKEIAILAFVVCLFAITILIDRWADQFPTLGDLPSAIHFQLNAAFFALLAIFSLISPFTFIFLGNRWPIFRSMTLSVTIGGFIAMSVALFVPIFIASNLYPSLAGIIIEARIRDIVKWYIAYVQVTLFFYVIEYAPRPQRTKSESIDRYYIMNDT